MLSACIIGLNCSKNLILDIMNAASLRKVLNIFTITRSSAGSQYLHAITAPCLPAMLPFVVRKISMPMQNVSVLDQQKFVAYLTLSCPLSWYRLCLPLLQAKGSSFLNNEQTDKPAEVSNRLQLSQVR